MVNNSNNNGHNNTISNTQFLFGSRPNSVRKRVNYIGNKIKHNSNIIRVILFCYCLVHEEICEEYF